MGSLCAHDASLIPCDVAWLVHIPALCSPQMSYVLSCSASGLGDALSFESCHPNASYSVSHACPCLSSKGLLCFFNVRLANDCSICEGRNERIFFSGISSSSGAPCSAHFSGCALRRWKCARARSQCRGVACFLESVSNVCWQRNGCT